MNCPVCDGSHAEFQRKLYDDRYGYPGEFSLLKCTICDHRYIENSFTDSEITNIYTNYYPRTSYKLDTHKPHLPSGRFFSWLNGEKSAAYRWVPEDIRILDIGCGFCQSLGYHTNRGCEVFGVEADENARRVGKKFGYKIHVGTFNANLYEKDFFDYVTLDQVIEHFIQPKETILGISRILKPGGYAILSTPNVKGWGARVFGKRWLNWHAPYHLHHFSKKSMEAIVEEGGFTIEKYYSITNSSWLYYQWLHLLTYPILGEPSKFWAPPNKIPQEKSLWLKIITRLHKMKVNHLITRVFDVLELGDNRIYILRKK